MSGRWVLMGPSRAVTSGLLLIAGVLATGCGVVEEKRQAYRASDSIAPLQLPESLVSPVSEEALMLPQPGSTITAEPFDTRPPAPVNLPAETKPEAKE